MGRCIDCDEPGDGEVANCAGFWRLDAESAALGEFSDCLHDFTTVIHCDLFFERDLHAVGRAYRE